MNPTITLGPREECPNKCGRGVVRINNAYTEFVSHLRQLKPFGDRPLIVMSLFSPVLYSRARLAGMDIVTRKIDGGYKVWRTQ